MMMNWRKSSKCICIESCNIKIVFFSLYLTGACQIFCVVCIEIINEFHPFTEQGLLFNVNELENKQKKSNNKST